MSGGKVRIGVVAPGGRSTPEVAERIQALAAAQYPQGTPEIVFHPQCFLSDGHFAGPDPARAAAFVEVANDETFDALWFARGGYGSGRLIELVLPRLTEAAERKTYLGYSDAGSMLGALYGRGFTQIAHGSLPQDIVRSGGEAAVARALAWLVERAPSSLEGGLVPGQKAVAFNLVILCHLLGTPWMPDLTGHVLLLEEVSEYMYRIDRSMLQLTSSPEIRKVAGIRLGRCSDIPPNDPDFGRTDEEVVRYWCERSGIPYLGRADIGHDVDNKVVPFGGI